MLYVVGLGLGDERDITLRGLDAVRKCDRVYLEAYTSILALGLGSSATATLEALYGRPVILAGREMVEQGAEGILEEARSKDVAFLVVGDPFGGKKEYEPARYMTVNTAIEQLLEIEEHRAEKVLHEGTLAVGLARLGNPSQNIVAGTMKELLEVDFGPPLHCLIIPGTTHVMEEEMLNYFRVK